MGRTILKILIILLTCTNLIQGQHYEIDWHSEDSVNVEKINAAFMEVVRWDGDTSIETARKRAGLADQLWEYYRENTLDESGEKALFFSFAISLRNQDYQVIQNRYQSVELGGDFWKIIYPYFRKSLFKSLSPEEVIQVLKSELKSSGEPIQAIQLTYDIGFWSYDQGALEEAAVYFTELLRLTENREDYQKERMRAATYLEGMASLQTGSKAANFKRTDTAGKEIELKDYEGQVVILHFWASWCGPCKKELPVLKAIYEEYQPDGLVIIGVSLDQEIGRLNDYIQTEQIAWRQIFAGEGREDPLVKQYSGFGLPTYYVIDKEGRIQYNYHSRKSGLELREVIEEFMK